ncbi:RHOMBOID-like protein 2 [Typha angustifolia]|uniref:RHOMBOID-like protein 2 n=1 Tax=Typha angustifolia TaxID=59011 RepID=UPI003C2C942E
MSNTDVENGGAKPRPKTMAQTGGHVPPSPFYYDSSARERRGWTSWLIPLFVLANVIVFVVAMYVNNCPDHHPSGSCKARFLRRFSFEPYHDNPLLGPSASTLLKMGALKWDKVVHGHQGWRLVTCIWSHAGLIHLAVNMISLVVIGIRLEQQFGFVRVGIIYLLSGFGGSILSALFMRNGISVGASGALFGLLGALLSELLTNWTIYTNRASALFTLVIIVAVNLAVGILPFVDNFAHIGGFLTGFLLGFVLLMQPHFKWLERRNLPPSSQPKSKYLAYQYVLLVVGLLLFVAGFAVGLIELFRGVNGNDHCHWCHYLTCVPTSKWTCNN